MLTAVVATTLLPAATLRVMTFNIWIGGTQFQPLPQTVKVIEASRADIVGIQEPANNLPAIAEGLKWNHSLKASIVTKYPIIEEWNIEGTRWGGARIQLPSGKVVFVYNDHLTPYPYGPYEVRDGKAKTPAEIYAQDVESRRLAETHLILRDMSKRVKLTDQVFFTGDFNTPSHLDWVESTKGRNFGMTAMWPVTAHIEAFGFKDAYRVAHPDPVAKPGFTWSPGYPVGKLEENDVMDRIDLVFYRGPGISVKSAEVVGETGPVTDIAVDPWPSDHRAVVAEFMVE